MQEIYWELKEERKEIKGGERKNTYIHTYIQRDRDRERSREKGREREREGGREREYVCERPRIFFRFFSTPTLLKGEENKELEKVDTLAYNLIHVHTYIHTYMNSQRCQDINII